MVTVVAPLVNFRGPDRLVIRPDVEIHTLPDHLRLHIQTAKFRDLIRHPSNPTHCLVLRDVAASPDDAAKPALEEAVLRLRLHKPGGVYFDFGMRDEHGWYDDPGRMEGASILYLAVFFYIVWGREGMAGTYELAPPDIKPLGALFGKTQGRSLMEESAFRFFFRGYHEPYPEDRFLSNVIGLENILANDQKEIANIRYKFVDRGCFLLRQAFSHPGPAEEYATNLRAIYDRRCKLVHAARRSQPGWTGEKDVMLLKRSEEYLRALLVHLIDHPEHTTAKGIDQAKREGY